MLDTNININVKAFENLKLLVKENVKQVILYHEISCVRGPLALTAMPQHKNPCWGRKIYNFCTSFLGFHYIVLHLSDLCSGVVTKILGEIHQ